VLNGRTQVEDKFDALEYLKNDSNTTGDFEAVVTQYENDLRILFERKFEEAKERQSQKATS